MQFCSLSSNWSTSQGKIWLTWTEIHASVEKYMGHEDNMYCIPQIQMQTFVLTA